MRVKLIVPSIVLVLVFAFGGLVSAAGTYPSQLPDFAHPDTPHVDAHPAVPPFSPASGQTDFHPTGQRALLVVYVRFSDYTNQVPESQIHDRFFPIGTFGTVANYYQNASFYNFSLRPAQESGGVPNDGVVTVDLGSSADFNAKSEPDQNGTVLNAVDPFVDFAYFDGVAGGGNGDGKVTWDELAFFWMATSQSAAENCGKNRGIPNNKVLDGKTLVFTASDARTLTNTMTLVHELGHQALNVDDLYIIGMGPYAIGAGTCGTNQNAYFYPNAYERVHWGWDEPLVVTKDGFYSVFNSADNGPAIYSYILYDPDKGPGDYFIVENRQQRNNTYDWSIADSGLIIWRVRDSAWPASQLTARVVNLMRPDGTIVPNAYGGSNVDAWDPSDTNTPQRTMSRPWDDGTPSNVAVRAIRQDQDFTSVNTITAYFDVRGPGVLVDPTTPQGALIRPSIAIGGTINVSFPVMNTGEATDTFDFTILVPTGWSATTQQMTLAAGQQATATIAVTASSAATEGFRTVAARGRSTTDSTISTTVDFFIDVTKRDVTLQYTGDTTVDYSDSATLSAVVRDAITNEPLAGKQVVFILFDESYSVTTGSDGVASTSVVVTEAPTIDTISVAVVEDATHRAKAIGAQLTVEPETVSIQIASPLVQSATGSPSLTLMATEEDDGSPGDLALAGAQIVLQPTLSATPQTLALNFDASGNGSVSLATVPADLWAMTISVSWKLLRRIESQHRTDPLRPGLACLRIGEWAGFDRQTSEARRRCEIFRDQSCWRGPDATQAIQV